MLSLAEREILARKIASRVIALEDASPKEASAGLRSKTAGEVRFIKDRGGDHAEWAWNPPGASERNIDPKYEFNAKNLKPLVKTLRSALMALGHIQTCRSTFTKIKSQRVSPDGNLGGVGYVQTIKDIRKQLSNCDEALSSITDTLYDEVNAIHWHPKVEDSGGNTRERQEVKEIIDNVEEIRKDPEAWAEDEEQEELDQMTQGKTAGRRISTDGDVVSVIYQLSKFGWTSEVVRGGLVLVHPRVDDWDDNGELRGDFHAPDERDLRRALGPAVAYDWTFREVTLREASKYVRIPGVDSRTRNEPYGVLMTRREEGVAHV